ncbi:MAG: hypothetical protein RhofKO_27300 [Rhodothermales bacterium]
MSSPKQIWTVIASDVAERDGIGVELYVDDQLVVEVFRDDTKKARQVTLYDKDVSLELVEEAIRVFRRKVDWAFVDG